MKLILKDKAKVAIFANIFRNLKNILDDANITFTPTKVYMQGMDQSHALLVELNIKKDWFDFYEADEDLDSGNFGLHCESFFHIINCLNDNQYIELLWENDADKMSIAFYGEETISKGFELTRLDMDLENMEIPDVEYQADICLKSSEFSELIKELSIFNDTVKITCTEEKIELLASGTLGSMTASIKEDDIVSYAIEEDTQLQLNYGLSFLDRVCHFDKLSTDIYIHCSTQYPMKINYPLNKISQEDDGVDDEDSLSPETASFCRFFLAPKHNTE